MPANSDNSAPDGIRTRGAYPWENIDMQAKEEAVDRIDWYLNRLRNINEGRPSAGFAEAKAGFESAMSELQELL